MTLRANHGSLAPMFSQISFADLMRKLALPAILLGLAYYLGSSMLSGENGYYARKDVTAELDAKKSELDRLVVTRQALDKKVSLMAPDHLDRDLLDEQARSVLGLAGDKEIVVILPEDEPDASPEDASENADGDEVATEAGLPKD